VVKLERLGVPTFTIRLTDSQAKQLETVAEALGMTKGSLIKSKLFPSGFTPRRVPRPDQKELSRIVGELGKWGSNLNQIAKKLNQFGASSYDYKEVERTRIELARIREATYKALGLSQ
jgi:hypothetical protein